MSGEEEVKQWSRYDLEDASIVAIDDESTTYAETGIGLTIGEGRTMNWAPNAEGEDNGEGHSWLAYSLDFSIKGGPDPDEGSMRKAKIVITGRHESGKRLKIFGKGWIGRDNHGQIEGSFERPPLIDIDGD